MLATAIWVAIGPAEEPTGLARIHRCHGRPPGDGGSVPPDASGSGPGRSRYPWQVRASDFDPAGNVNNTVHWQAAEDILAGLGWLPTAAELEYHPPSCLATPAAPADWIRLRLVPPSCS
jgi:hypothetical protein